MPPKAHSWPRRFIAEPSNERRIAFLTAYNRKYGTKKIAVPMAAAQAYRLGLPARVRDTVHPQWRSVRAIGQDGAGEHTPGVLR